MGALPLVKKAWGLVGAGIAAVAIVAAVAATMVTAPEAPGQDMMGNMVQDMAQADKAVVYATFYPYAEFARAVTGDLAEVRQLGPAGAGAHDWEPGSAEIEALSDAAALVHSGEDIEPYIDELENIESMTNVLFIAASEQAHDKEHGDGHDEEHGDGHDEEREDGHDEEHGDGHDEEREDGHDEEHGDGHDEEREDGHDEEHGDGHGSEVTHSWLDPIEVIEQVEFIRDSLSTLHPNNTAVYAANAASYIAELNMLDERYMNGLDECEHTTIVTFHNAFDAVADRYGLEVLGIAHSHHAEPSVAEIAELAEYARESGALAIFSDDLTDGRVEMAAAEELGVDVIALSTLEGLARTDAPGTTYIEKMVSNLEAFREGLACR